MLITSEGATDTAVVPATTAAAAASGVTGEAGRASAGTHGVVGAASKNWSGTLTFSAPIQHPRTMDELRHLVGHSTQVKAVGSRHSFTPVADTTGTLLSLDEMPGAIDVDMTAQRVRVPAGIRYGQLARRLDTAGLALHNMGSLPHISVVGACSTGTHGSGVANANLGTAVSAIDLVTAGGDLVTFDRAGLRDRFDGAVIALGCLGVVTAMTLEVEPAYEMRQDVYTDLSFDAFAANAEAVLGAGYSVSLFTDFAARNFGQVWVKRRLEPGAGPAVPDALFGAPRARHDVHPIPGMSPEPTTVQRGIPGRWFERLPHFKVDFQPGFGEELQSEHFVARADVVAEVEALFALREIIGPVTRVAELRTTAADRLWLSPQYDRDTAGISFTWRHDPVAVARAVAAVDHSLSDLAVRPHWGKLFGTRPDQIAARYPRLPDFRALAEEFDPTGTFRSDFARTYLWAGDG